MLDERRPVISKLLSVRGIFLTSPVATFPHCVERFQPQLPPEAPSYTPWIRDAFGYFARGFDASAARIHPLLLTGEMAQFFAEFQ